MHSIHHVRQINNPKLRKSEYKVRNQTKAIKLGFYMDETRGKTHFFPRFPIPNPRILLGRKIKELKTFSAVKQTKSTDSFRK